MPLIVLSEFRQLVGRSLGVSPWLPVSQRMIDLFAEATGDDQFIHVNPERARQTRFGGTIAHGFLTLALLPQLFALADPPWPASVQFRLNYGLNRARFTAAVPSGSRVRARFNLQTLEEKRPAQFQMTLECIIEVENAEKPALIAEWITQFFV